MCLARLFAPGGSGGLARSSSACSLVSNEALEEFEETRETVARAANPSKVRFDLEKNGVHRIPSLDEFGWRCRRECYWQPEEYAAMSQSRLRLERAVLETGGRVPIEGESRRGLGLVCEPETRLARASKIQQTSRAVLRMHAEGASATRLARFAADASSWATRNALITAEKDVSAARDALRPPHAHAQAAAGPRKQTPHAASSERQPASTTPETPDRTVGAATNGLLTTSDLLVDHGRQSMPRCDSNTASTDGLASMIRNDSLNNMATLVKVSKQESPISDLETYSSSRIRHRIAPAAARA